MPDRPTLHEDDALRRVYAEIARPDGPHPDEDTLGRLLGGRLRATEREATLDHVAQCADCASLVQHVARCAECRSELSPPPPIHWRWLPVLIPLAAAAGLILFVWLGPRRETPPTAMARRRPSPTQPPVAAPHDDAGGARLTTDGTLPTVPGATDDLRRELAASLRTGSIPLPTELAELRRDGLKMMGAPAVAAFRVLSPEITIVRTDTPTFRWTSAPGATSYAVSVYREDLTPVLSSGRVQSTEWTPARTLRRGATYLWQVAATPPAGRQLTPAPPEPEARFRVMGAEAAAALEKALLPVQESALACGFLLARAGVLEESEQRLAELVRADPSSTEAVKLLEAVRRARR